MTLTPEEREEKGRELADKIEERETVAEEKKTTAARYKARIDGIDHQIERLAWAVRTGLVPEEDRQLGLGIDAE